MNIPELIGVLANLIGIIAAAVGFLSYIGKRKGRKQEEVDAAADLRVTPTEQAEAVEMVSRPAISLMTVCVLGTFLNVLVLLVSASIVNEGVPVDVNLSRFRLPLITSIPAVMIGIVGGIAGFQMRSLRNYTLAIAASVGVTTLGVPGLLFPWGWFPPLPALIGLCLSLSGLVGGLAVGIWNMAVLSSPHIRDSFAT